MPTKTLIASAPEVRAFIRGADMFRVPVVPQPGPTAHLSFDGHNEHWYANGLVVDCKRGPWKSPYHPGDVIGIRETWKIVWAARGGIGVQYFPAPKGAQHTDDSVCRWSDDDKTLDTSWLHKKYGGNWPTEPKRPAATMPRWAIRIWLNVLTVDCERLQVISPSDVIDSGFDEDAFWDTACNSTGRFLRDDEPIAAYRDHWTASRYGKRYPWESDPWCFVYTVERRSDEHAT